MKPFTSYGVFGIGVGRSTHSGGSPARKAPFSALKKSASIPKMLESGHLTGKKSSLE
jgi:hypothetical protein